MFTYATIFFNILTDQNFWWGCYFSRTRGLVMTCIFCFFGTFQSKPETVQTVLLDGCWEHILHIHTNIENRPFSWSSTPCEMGLMVNTNKTLNDIVNKNNPGNISHILNIGTKIIIKSFPGNFLVSVIDFSWK